MKNLTIIQETRAGLLAEVTTLLEKHGIDLRSLDGNTVGKLAVINLVAEPYRKSLDVLADAGFQVFSNEQVLVRCEDQPGALAEISRRLANVQIDVRSVHLIDREDKHCIVALETDNDYAARKALRDLLV